MYFLHFITEAFLTPEALRQCGFDFQIKSNQIKFIRHK